MPDHASLARAAALAATLVLGLAGSVPAQAVTPFTLGPRGHVLVPVRLDGGEPLVFALDTGAERSSVGPEAARRAGLPEVPGEAVRMQGIHGLTEHAEVRCASLLIGEPGDPADAGSDTPDPTVTVEDLVLVAFGLDHISHGEFALDGLLGVDVLRRFDLVLDFGRHELTWAPRVDAADDAADAATDGSASAPFETIAGGLVLLPVSVDGRPVQALLDTGSGHSGLNGHAARSLGVELPELPTGADGHGHGITLDTGPLRLGEHVLAERPRVHVMDHPLMAVLGLADGPSMLLGTDLLAGQVVTLSYGRDRVWVEDSEG